MSLNILMTNQHCHLAPSHPLNQCWLRSMLPYGITRLFWNCYQINVTGHANDESTLVQVTTSHYLSQCWPRSMLPYGITRLFWNCYQINVTGHTNDESTSVQVTTSHYLRQCWPRSMFPYGITRPQSSRLSHKYCEICNIRHTQSPKLKQLSSRLAVAFGQSIEARC